MLEQSEHLTAILEGFSEVGIRGTTILNSTGMGRVLTQRKADAPGMAEISRVLA